MEPRDVPVVAAIDRLSFPTPWPSAAFQRELGRDGATYAVLVVDDGSASRASSRGRQCWLRRILRGGWADRVVGYVGFRVEGEGGHITTLAVHPGWRGRRLGELLLLVALDGMGKSGIDLVRLEMRPSNDVAYRLYRKYGFRVVERRRAYYRDGEDAWVMEARIEDRDYGQRLSQVRQAVAQKLAHADDRGGQAGSGAL